MDDEKITFPTGEERRKLILKLSKELENEPQRGDSPAILNGEVVKDANGKVLTGNEYWDRIFPPFTIIAGEGLPPDEWIINTK